MGVKTKGAEHRNSREGTQEQVAKISEDFGSNREKTTNAELAKQAKSLAESLR